VVWGGNFDGEIGRALDLPTFFLNMVAQTLTYNCTNVAFIPSFRADNAISNDLWLLLKVDDCLLGFAPKAPSVFREAPLAFNSRWMSRTSSFWETAPLRFSRGK
jgi:hypothetical protein